LNVSRLLNFIAQYLTVFIPLRNLAVLEHILVCTAYEMENNFEENCMLYFAKIKICPEA